jgi:GrpB-like predicted nucleotidyltransferase (UPF0157 family)
MPNRFPIQIVEYNPDWPRRFAAEREQLAVVFRPLTVRIEHIGSTAVPGLGAKPIIDIMLGVDRIEDVQTSISALDANGYEYRPDMEATLPGRRFFVKPPAHPRKVHLHVVEHATPFWERHLRFRNLLRSHPAAAAEYLALKRRLAIEFADNREGYTDAKTEFIEAILKTAESDP